MLRLVALSLLLGALPAGAGASSFVTFESVQFRPLALSPSRTLLFATNTPDNRLEILATSSTEDLVSVASVAVGLEPVAVAARSETEAWVVNHLSDSVSIVELSGDTPTVVRTLHVGDEPRDIVFGGPDRRWAFVSAAHRGQNTPYVDEGNPGELTTPGIGRTDVWVFDTLDLGAPLGGTPLRILTFFGDAPGPLAVDPSGQHVYVGVFKSGNGTTTIPEPVVCDGGVAALPCRALDGEPLAPGGLPPPNVDIDGVPQPEVSLIVQNEGTAWWDELGRDWSAVVRFELPDLDVFEIDASGGLPRPGREFARVGTVLFGMAVNPRTGELYVTNTEAGNAKRFAGQRPAGDDTSSVIGDLHRARVTVIHPESGDVVPRHLNPHIDYAVPTASADVRERSVATPMGVAVSGDGSTLFLAANGSAKVAILPAGDGISPSNAAHVELSAGGPTGLVVDELGRRLYVLTRFDNGISVVDLDAEVEVSHHTLFNPEPSWVVEGRPFLYDARATSGNGEASCASCHVGGDKDELAWDLGNPRDSVVVNPNPFLFRPPGLPEPIFPGMKGPMTTQTLRGLAGHGPMHWRGDRTGGSEPGGDPLDEAAAFLSFNGAFVELQGRSEELSEEDMQAFTDFVLEIQPPPNPIRALDDSLTALQAAGEDIYRNQPINAFGATCETCHPLDPGQGFFGTDGLTSVVGPPASLGIIDFKAPHLRNLYERVGMFGMPATPVTAAEGDHGDMGRQIRGVGFFHDGAFDTVLRTLNLAIFDFPEGGAQRRAVEQFLFAFDSNLKPIVGQQVTIDSAADAATEARVELLVERAQRGDAELVGHLGARSYLMRDDGRFWSDRAGDRLVTLAALREESLNRELPLTFLAVPVGSGLRIALDRDEDGVFDQDELDQGTRPDDPTSFSRDPVAIRAPGTRPVAAR